MLGLGATLLNPPYNPTHSFALKSPFDIVQNVTAATQPKIFNATNPSGTLLSNTTTNVSNATGNGILGPLYFLNPWYIISLLWVFVQFITGLFVWNALLVVHMPLPAVALIASIVYILIARSLLYYVTGR